MNPPPMLLVAHPGFAEGLLDAAESILGTRPILDALSNRDLGQEALDARIVAWLAAHPGPALILTDLEFGSCCQAARRVTRGRGDVGVVTGVNLPVLLALIRSRDNASLEDLLRHVAERGRSGVEVFLGGVKA